MIKAGSRFKALTALTLSLTSMLMLSGLQNANAMGRGYVAATVTPTPAPNTGAKTQPISGASSCVSSDPDHICIGLKVVSYVSDSTPVLNQVQAIALVEGINAIWSQCNISFQLETYESSDPTTVGLSFNTNWKKAGDAVRTTYNDNASFLVVTVGQLSGATIGVTQMPGTGVYGSLIEDGYAQNAMTVGHELGHYQGLYHVSDANNLMYAYIGSHTSTLTADQCATARSTDQSNWKKMFRN